jgi:ArsR family transcriptional regulator
MGLFVSVLLGGAGVGADQRLADAPGPDPTRRMSIDEFTAAHAAGTILVVDVRGATSHRMGHIPGAISVPVRDVAKSIDVVRTKARGRRVVTYCSCPDEHLSNQAAVELSKRGITNVAALVGGYLEWLAVGGKVERGK